MSRIISFGGIEAPPFFYTKDLTVSALPPVDVKTLQVAGMDGEYYTGKEYGANTITVEYFIKAPDRNGLLYVIEQLGAWLASDGPQPLIFSDKPDRTYYAIVKDSTSVDKAREIGKGTITFFLPDPYSYGDIRSFILLPNTLQTVESKCTAEAYPRFKVKFKKPSSYCSFISPDGVVLIGNPNQPDKTTIQARETVLYDNMSSTGTWQPAAGTSVDGDIVQGAFQSSGFSFGVNDFGTQPTSGNGWYGPAMRRDLSKAAQDFELTVKMGLDSNGLNQMGRCELYMYDINGVRIGKVQIKDNYAAYEFTVAEARIGSLSDALGYQLINTEENAIRTRTIIQKINGKFKTKTIKQEVIGPYNAFDGYFTFRREGLRYFAQVGKYTEDGKPTTRTTATYVDEAKKYPQTPLAYIVIHMAKYKDLPTPKQKFWIDDIRVTKLNKPASTENARIFSAGDELDVDMSTGEILCNGVDFQENLDIGSTFFPLTGGVFTDLQVLSEDDTAEITMSMRERFL